MRPLLLLLLCAFSMIGCASRRSVLRQIDASFATLDSIALRGRIASLTIRDQREGITTEPIDLPFLSFPGMEDQVAPPLHDSLRAMIETYVRDHTAPGDSAFAVEITLVEGIQRFEATLAEEVELARWVTEVRVSGAGREGFGRSRVEFAYGSMDASRKFINELFGRVLRLTVAVAFDDATKQMRSAQVIRSPRSNPPVPPAAAAPSGTSTEGRAE